MAFGFRVGGEWLAIPKGGAAGWTLSYGVKPNVEVFTTTKATADKILARADAQFPTSRTIRRDNQPEGPIAVELLDADAEGNPTGRSVKIEGLYVVVGNRPGLDFNSASITVADRRILFATKFIEASYNIRRKTGDYRIVRGVMEPIEKGIRAPDFAYRRSTLNPDTGEPWTAKEVLEDVLSQLVGPSGFGFDGGAASFLDVPVEGLVLRDRGDQALARVLSFVPGAAVYAGLDGRIRVANIYDQSEAGVFDGLGPPNGGHWRKVDRSPLRPSGYRVFADREVELRFDLIEDGTLRSITRGREEPYLENVITNPLFELELESGEVAAQGELISLDDFLWAMNNKAPISPLYVSAGISITRNVILRDWLGRWGGLRRAYALLANGEVDEERAKLLGALRNDFRRLFRILPQWRDKIRTLIARRSGVFDAETGTFAAAIVHATYIRKVTPTGYVPVNDGAAAVNVDTYGDGDITSRAVAPFAVEVVNADTGVLRISPTLDQTGLAEDYILGATKGGKLPRAQAGSIISWADCELDESFKLAIVLTAKQDSPNGTGRLHRDFVTPQEAAAKLGVSDDLRNAGPIFELYQSAAPARYAWMDEHAGAIKEAFYTGAAYPEIPHSNRATMREAALALAAADYATRLDRVEGRAVFPLAPITPTGNLRTVQFVVTLGARGELSAFAILTAPGEVEAAPIWSGLPEGIRRKLLGLVED